MTEGTRGVCGLSRTPPFGLTELDHLALTGDYARALALADAQAQASDAYASDDSGQTTLVL